VRPVSPFYFIISFPFPFSFPKVRLHRLLLEHYASNPPAMNHACVSFFHRLCSTYLPLDEVGPMDEVKSE